MHQSLEVAKVEGVSDSDPDSISVQDLMQGPNKTKKGRGQQDSETNNNTKKIRSKTRRGWGRGRNESLEVAEVEGVTDSDLSIQDLKNICNKD